MTTHKIPKKFWDKKMVEWPCPNCGQKTLQNFRRIFHTVRTLLETIKMQAEEWFDLRLYKLGIQLHVTVRKTSM